MHLGASAGIGDDQAGIEAIGSSFTQSFQRNRRMPSVEERTGLLDNIGRVTMPVSAVLETSLPGVFAVGASWLAVNRLRSFSVAGETG